MSRLVPAPCLSVALWVVWLLLNRTLAPAQLLLGALLAWAIPLLTVAPEGGQCGIRRPWVALRLAAVVLRDIVVSSLVVARQILGAEAAITPGFVRVPLALTDVHAIATLAGIITMTPGTLTCDIASDRGHLLVHAFHLTDADALVADIKARYEAPLREIFE
jgi:multicomponent K+:H+ antiporter subunit E